MALSLQSLGGEDESNLRDRPLRVLVRVVEPTSKPSPLEGNDTMFPTDSLSTAKSEEARSAFIMLAASSASRNSCSSLRATFSSLVVSMKVFVKVKLFRGEVVGDPRGDDLGKIRGVDRGEDLGALPILFGRLSLFERTN